VRKLIKLSGIFLLLISIKSFSQCPAVADFDFQRMCNDGVVNFTDQSYIAGTGLIVGWNWDFGDGNTSAIQNPNHDFIPGFTYNVQLAVTDSSGCSDTIIIPVFVNPLPSASFTFNPNNICSEAIINFTNNSTGLGITYSWDFGDGGPTSTQPNPTHSYIAFGCGSQNFNVTLTVTDLNGCTSTETQIVTVLQQPEVMFVENNGFTFCHTDTTNILDNAIVYNFSPSAGCITSYTVDWGDGTPIENITPPFDAANPIQHTYTTLGYYTVTFTAIGANGCITTDIQSASIESNPVAVLIGPPMGTNTGCAPMQICVTNMSQNISSTTNLELDWGDGFTEILPPSAVGDTVCHIYHVSGCENGVMTNYSITLTASNTCDFSSNTWSPIRIFTPPEAEFIIVDDSICIDDLAVFINTTEPNSCAFSAFTTYTWDFGDGSTFGPTPVHWSTLPQQTVTHSYGDTGTYIVTVTATNNSPNGCGSSEYSMSIYVSDAYAQFDWDTVCFGDPTLFTDQSWAPGATIISWEWNFGDGSTSTQQNPIHTYNSWGDFTACLAVTSNLGCTDTICHIIHVDTLPFVEFTFDTICFGDTTHFTNLSFGHGSTIVSNQWFFGDGNTSTETHPSHYYNASGSYTVTLIVIDSNGCTDTIQHIVPVSPPPEANFTADTTCFGYPTGFVSTSTTSFGTIVSWEWEFGDGSTAIGANTSHTYGDTGVYYVTHIVITDIGCTDTIVLPIYISPNPEANFSADTVCAGDPTSFTDLSDGNGTTITTWQWNFGDGNTSADQNPTHIYSQGGTHNVTLIVTNQFNCIDTVILPVFVDSIPFANFSFVPACLGYSTIFNDESVTFGSTITSWEWNFGDGSTSTIQNPTHTYGSSGTFTVTLIVTNSNGCTDTISLPVTVYEPPVADFTWIGSCLGFSTDFTDTSVPASGAISTWNWDFGDGSGTSNAQNPSYTYSNTGFYNVTLIVTDINGCADTIVQSIYVGPLPTAEFSNTSACAGDTVFFTDLSNGNGHPITTWEWDFGDGSTSNLQNPSHQFGSSGTFTVQLIVVNDLGCVDTITHIIIADSLPTAQFSAIPVCLGDTTYFNDASLPNGGTINSWYWDFGDGNTSNQQHPAHLYTSDGTFNVTLVVENTAGCIDSITIPIIVRPLPVADFDWISACVNQQLSFNDLSSGSGAINSWQWDFGDGIGSSIVQNPDYSYSIVDTYDVTLIVTDVFGCENFVVIPVIVETVPTAQFFADSVCLGAFTSFTDLSNGNGSVITTWDWDFGDGNTSATQNTQNQYPASGDYTVQLIVSNTANCADTATAQIFVKPTPDANFSSIDVCDGNAITFNDLSIHNSLNIQSWSWDLGDGTTTTMQNPSNTYAGPGIYGVELIVVNDWGCYDTILQNVEVYALPIPEFAAGVACLGFETSFQDLSTPQGSPINSWHWDFGDGVGTSAQQNPDWTYSTGTPPYNVTLIIEDANGCTDSISHSIDLHPQPVANFSASTACSQSPTQFNDLSVPAFGTMQTWSWDFGDGTGNSNVQNPDYTYAPVGAVTTFNVTLIATDSNGCPDTTMQSVTVNPQPLADFTTDTVCSGSTTHFFDISSPLTGTIQTWDWDFGDGSGTAIQQNPVYTYNTVTSITNFTTTLVITDSNGCSDTIVKNAVINPLPVPDFSATTMCTGDATTFNDLSFSNGGNITSWDWDFGDGVGNSTTQSPTYTYTTVLNPTTFDVNLSIEDVNGCIKDTTLPVLVNPLPIADFNNNATCSGFPSSFTDLSGSTGGTIDTWSWDFGDGSGTSNQQNPDYTYASTSTIDVYDVTLTVTDENGCSDAIMYQATVIPSPNSDFVSDSVCSGITAQFNDLSSTLGGTLVSWNWDFGDGTGNSNLQNPDYLYGNVLATTTYQVELVVENSFGCRDTINQISVVYPLPVADFSTDTVCMGGVTNFLDESTGPGGNLTTWSWDFGDGSGTSNQQNPQYTYLNHGFYQVEVNVTDVNSCQGTIVHTVFVDSLPMPSFTWTPTCAPGIINFNNTSDGNGSIIVSYLWNFDDGYMGGMQNPIHYFSSNGDYDVSLYVHNNRGCSNIVVVTVSVNPGLEVDFTAASVCLGEDMYFLHSLVNPNMPIETWLWSFGDGTYSTDPNPVHLYNQPGTYNTLLTVTDSLGCDFTIAHQVTVYVNPVADFNATTVQVNNPTSFTDLSFTANGFIASWQWSFDDGGTSTQQNPMHTYTNAGTYMVTLIVFNDFGCSDTITHPVIVNAIVSADFIADTVCSGTPTTFTDLSHTGIGTITSWYWNFGNGYSSVLQNPQHVYASDGIYTVTLIVTSDFGILDTVSYQIVVLESPTADFTSTEVCFGNPTGLFDQSSGNIFPVSEWQWQMGDGTSSLQPTVQHYYQSAGQWQVQLVATNTIGCSDTIIKPVNVWEIPQISFDADPRDGCLPLNVHFTDLTAIGDGVIVSWLWDFGDGYTSVSAGGAVHNYPYPSIFDVSLSVVSNHGCESSLTVPNMIQVYPSPTAAFFFQPTTPTIAEGVVFTDMSLGANQWWWDFGDNGSSFEQSPMHHYYHPGSYTVVQVVYNEYGCADTTSMRIRLDNDEMIWFPNAISINGDGQNEVFHVYGSGWQSENFELRIFSRWGKELFYTTDINKGWDGTDSNSGEKVQIGVYVWKVKVMDFSYNIINYKGVVTVIQ